MEDLFKDENNYKNIFNRIEKKYSKDEGLIIMKKLYFTNNLFYYYLCLLLRFVHLISFSGDYFNLYSKNYILNSFQKYVKLLTCYNILKYCEITYIFYSLIVIFILVLFIIRKVIEIYIKGEFNNYKNTNKWPLPSKYHIIIDHINFLLFPYIIEFLSFIYYIYFFSHKFIIKINVINNTYSYIIIIINTFLIIGYNIDNYIYMICINRIYSITILEAYLNVKERNKIIYRPIKYRCKNFTIYITIFLQNFVLFLNIENYFNNFFKIIFKIMVSSILFLSILLFIFNQINIFNYSNSFNTTINILTLFCFYSIIIDLIIFLFGKEIKIEKNEIIYILIKLFLSYITQLLLKIKTYKFLESKITKILFEEKSNIKEKYFINCYYLLHQIMLKIKMENDIKSAILLQIILNKHIYKCNKTVCNCKLFNAFINQNDYEKPNEEKIKDDISDILAISNYLFECSFINYDFYNNFDLIIVLAEHFCHLKENPIMAFSFISTFILKQGNKCSQFENVILYELCQQYINYLSAIRINEIENEIKKSQYKRLLDKKREDKFKEYFYILKMSYKVKNLICNYIFNVIKILKYKYIFEDSISFQFDENNENIISAKIVFFNITSRIDNFYNDSYYKNKKKKRNKKYGKNTNIYIIIDLLKRTQSSYIKIINSINQIEVMKGIPIFMIFKYILFFDFFEGEKIPSEVVNTLYGSLTNTKNLYSNLITIKEYNDLKIRYNEENNRINSKIHIIVELKRELRTKYFCEDGALKLGYKQKDILNEKINILMPNEFSKSHQNAIKQLIIGGQIKNNISKNSFLFDKSSTVLYSSNFEISLIYNISKSLMVIIESIFNFENKYIFMLNNNFEILANSINFQDEYYLNQKILKTYNIDLMDILKIKPEKLNKIFENELNKIKNQKFIRQIKTEEYFIPQFYVPHGEKIISMMNQSYFDTSKNNILYKIVNIDKNDTGNNNDSNIDEDNEGKKFIKKSNINQVINDLIVKPTDIVFYNSYDKKINKGNFIENMAKELIKIPDNDLMIENDKIIYNLILSSKNLISKLLTKNEIINEFLMVKIEFRFYYDKPFYFITIDDEKKLYLNILKEIHFSNSQINNTQTLSSTSSPKFSPRKKRKKNLNYKYEKKPKNKVVNFTENNNSFNIEEKMNNSNYNTNSNIDENSFNTHFENNDKIIVLAKINANREKINKDKFILIIK